MAKGFGAHRSALAIAVGLCCGLATPAWVAAQEDTAALCQNGVDDDGDSYADCADQDCGLFVFCQSAAAPPVVAPPVVAPPVVAPPAVTPAAAPARFAYPQEGTAPGATGPSASGPVVVPAPARDTELPTFIGLFHVGPGLEWNFVGGTLGLGFAVGGGGVYFTVATRMSAGAGWSRGNPGVELDVEAGLRFLIDAGSITPHIIAVGSYGHVWSWSQRYAPNVWEWNVFYARLGGGVVFGEGRVRPGVEATFNVGHAQHHDCCESNPWGEDYSEAAFSGTLRFMLTF